MRLLALLALAGCASAAIADEKPAANGANAANNPQVAGTTLRLRAGDVQTAALPNLLQPADQTPLQAPAYVLVLREPLNDAISAQLATLGVFVLAPAPERAALVSLAWAIAQDAGEKDAARRFAEVRAGLRALAFVDALVVFDPSWKIDPALLAGKPQFAFESPDRLAAQAKGDVLAQVQFVPGTTPQQAREEIAALNAKGARVSVLNEETVAGPLFNGFTFDETSLIVRLPAANVGMLAEASRVLFAEHAPEFATRSNGTTRWFMQSAAPNATPFYDRGLTGAGEIIGLLDDPFNTSHCAVFDVQPIGPTHRKLVAYNGFAGNVTHGIHVSTTLAGEDPSNDNLRGVAYQARLAFNNLPQFGEANVYSRFELHRSQGAFVHNNSWGSQITSDYDSTSRAVDNFMWTNEDQLLVFSVANLTTIRNPENAKNVVAVGAIRSYPNDGEYCQGGRGPTLDGRRKPEVMAPGCSIISGGAGPCSTAILTGTSMATPAVSGLAALLRQYFVQGFYPSGIAVAGSGFVPSGALLRAMIANSAQDISGITDYPSTQEGWGRALGDSAAYFAGDSRKLIVKDVRRNTPRALTAGQTEQFEVDVRAGQELRVTLAYTDAPGAIFAAAPVVNNLNLRVIAPGNVTYLGNVFSGRQSLAGGSADLLNNLEQVLLRTPNAGRYTIVIDAPQVQVGPQGYSVVISGDVASTSICDSIDFNNDGLFPSEEDLIDFFVVYGGGACSTGNACNDIDFNNDGLFPDDSDILAFLRVLAGGSCE